MRILIMKDGVMTYMKITKKMKKSADAQTPGPKKQRERMPASSRPTVRLAAALHPQGTQGLTQGVTQGSWQRRSLCVCVWSDVRRVPVAGRYAEPREARRSWMLDRRRLFLRSQRLLLLLLPLAPQSRPSRPCGGATTCAAVPRGPLTLI